MNVGYFQLLCRRFAYSFWPHRKRTVMCDCRSCVQFLLHSSDGPLLADDRMDCRCESRSTLRSHWPMPFHSRCMLNNSPLSHSGLIVRSVAMVSVVLVGPVAAYSRLSQHFWSAIMASLVDIFHVCGSNMRRHHFVCLAWNWIHATIVEYMLRVILRSDWCTVPVDENRLCPLVLLHLTRRLTTFSSLVCSKICIQESRWFCRNER